MIRDVVVGRVRPDVPRRQVEEALAAIVAREPAGCLDLRVGVEAAHPRGLRLRPGRLLAGLPDRRGRPDDGHASGGFERFFQHLGTETDHATSQQPPFIPDFPRMQAAARQHTCGSAPPPPRTRSTVRSAFLRRHLIEGNRT
jgi:hypothetical protein